MTSVKSQTPTTSLPGLLSNFVSHFRRAIQQEMEAMRERRGSFEVVLTDGQRTVLDEPASGVAYTFRALSLDEKLVVGLECTLRASGSEELDQNSRFRSFPLSACRVLRSNPVGLQTGYNERQ